MMCGLATFIVVGLLVVMIVVQTVALALSGGQTSGDVAPAADSPDDINNACRPDARTCASSQ